MPEEAAFEIGARSETPCASESTLFAVELIFGKKHVSVAFTGGKDCKKQKLSPLHWIKMAMLLKPDHAKPYEAVRSNTSVREPLPARGWSDRAGTESASAVWANIAQNVLHANTAAFYGSAFLRHASQPSNPPKFLVFQARSVVSLRAVPVQLYGSMASTTRNPMMKSLMKGL